MGFDEAILRCLSRYATLSGRARLSEFWWFLTLYLLVAALALTCLMLLPAVLNPVLAVAAALTPPMVAVTVRRLHDVGASGWTLVFLLPVIGQVLLIAWLTRGSIPRRNRFGPQPGENDGRYLLYAR